MLIKKMGHSTSEICTSETQLTEGTESLYDISRIANANYKMYASFIKV